jgi:hypothetical protein
MLEAALFDRGLIDQVLDRELRQALDALAPACRFGMPAC